MAVYAAPKPTYRLALLSTVFAFAVIMLGAFTRLADAGLGCPDWPGCYGHVLWPDTAAEVSAAEALYPDAPVEHEKTWPEMVHRYLAAALGVLAIVLLAGAWRHRSSTQPLKLPLLLLATIILQGMFGMWTVTLKLWPQVVTAHLLGGFTTTALFCLLALRLRNANWRSDPASIRTLSRFRPLALLCLLVVFLQIALGGWTTSNYAALACPDFPTCQAEWLPTMDFANGFNALQGIGPNYLGGTLDNAARVAIHFSHRIGAIVAALVLCAVLLTLLRRSRFAPARGLAAFILVVLVAQIGLGIGNVVLHFPITVAVAHNAVGALLLLSVVALAYHLFTIEQVSENNDD